MNCVLGIAAVIIFFGIYGISLKAFKPVLLFFIAAGVTVVCGYLVFGILATGSLSLPLIVAWLKGYFGNSQYGSLTNFHNLADTFRIIIFTFLYSTKDLAGKILRNILFILMLLPLAGYGIYLKRLDKLHRLLFIAAVTQLIIMSLLIQWWEPLNPKFWLLAAVPLMMLIVNICSIWHAALVKADGNPVIKKIAVYYYLAVAGLIFAFNLQTGIIPQTRPDPAFQSAIAQWVNNTDSNDLLITMGSMVPHLRYYYDRRHTVHPYNYLRRSNNSKDTFAYLRRRIDATLEGGYQVYYAPLLADYIPIERLKHLGITRQDIHHFFANYLSEPAFEYNNLIDGNLSPVRRITGKVKKE